MIAQVVVNPRPRPRRPLFNFW